METMSLGLVIVFCIVALIVGAVIGFFIGRRTADDQKQIRDLKGELANSRSEHEAYRQQVNNHFQKTSELFGRLTDNYKTVFLHLAEGSQELCSSEAAKLKPVSENFPSLEHKRQEQAVKKPSTAPPNQKDTSETSDTDTAKQLDEKHLPNESAGENEQGTEVKVKQGTREEENKTEYA